MMNSAEYITIANIRDFKEVSIRSYRLFGKKIGIIKLEDGSFQAIEVACKHQGADLTKGKVVDFIATCHRHQWQYNLLTGECLNHDSPPLRRYPLVVENEKIKIIPIPLDDTR
jgi:nitrite reductase/ring-hydroxylating ferredoxin subunit